MKRIFFILIIVFSFFTKSFSSWAALGEYLSEGDKAFLETLELDYQEIGLELGTAVTLSVNGHRFHADLGTLARKCLYFREMFKSDTGENTTREKILTSKGTHEIVLNNIHEDFLVKILRLIYEGEFDPFDPKLNQKNSLTLQFLQKLDYYLLNAYMEKVVKDLEVVDEASFQNILPLLTTDCLDSAEGIVTRKCKEYCQKKWGNSYLQSVFNAFGPDYFKAKAPEFFKVVNAENPRDPREGFPVGDKKYIFVLDNDNHLQLGEIMERNTQQIRVCRYGTHYEATRWYSYQSKDLKFIQNEYELVAFIDSSGEGNRAEKRVKELRVQLEKIVGY